MKVCRTVMPAFPAKATFYFSLEPKIDGISAKEVVINFTDLASVEIGKYSIDLGPVLLNKK